MEQFEIDDVVDRALAEGPRRRRPHDGLADTPPGRRGRARVVAKGEGILAGGEVAVAVWKRLDPSIRIASILPDGSTLRPSDLIAEIEGSVAAILKGERTAINFLQHMSGVATGTNRFVRAVEGLPARIVDTRKTVPGLPRAPEVTPSGSGGGSNHRRSLGDGVLIKDNHIEALRSEGVGLSEAMRRASARHTLRVEIEVETMEQVSEALEAGADILLLDNMTVAEMAEGRVPGERPGSHGGIGQHQPGERPRRRGDGPWTSYP